MPPNPAPPADGEFTAFESGQVRPMAMSPDGNTLYVVNTPDNRLEVLDISGASPVLVQSVNVGLEPVSVAAHPDAGQVWVVNHLSDSVSIIDVTVSPARVVRTLLVGDEPRDIVFAGPGRQRAFISTAHRGQNAPFNPRLLDSGVGRADVWVFDVNNLGSGLGGDELTIVNMFADTPRALAVSPDGSVVYAAVLNSGNKTTVLNADIENGGVNKPSPRRSADGELQPETGLIVKFNGDDWVDNGDPTRGVPGQTWNDWVKLTLPDNDVFAINADANPPRSIGAATGVGTTLFNAVVNPVNGKLYVSNTDARNHVRFEGPGSFSTTVRGHFVESRITVLELEADNDITVLPRHLNKHITSYDQNLGSADENRRSLSMPLEMAVAADGNTLYVAAFGSGKVGIYNTNELENDTFTPSVASQIDVGGGPSGLVIDDARQRLFVLTRFDNSVVTVDLGNRNVVNRLAMFNPEPGYIVNGRPFLYDASLTSSRGDSSCGGCHIFGDMDHLAWDLGNPDGTVEASPNPYNDVSGDSAKLPFFHPMKGPMTTQSFRGMRNHGTQHWRGDRTAVSRDANETIEEQAFEDFNVAFTGLLGRAQELNESQMDAFAKFALAINYPPNPVRALNNSLTGYQAAGRDFYMNENSLAPIAGRTGTCNDCHRLDPAAGLFGTDGTQSVEGPEIAEDFKIPQLRNMYQKVGMFGTNFAPARNAPNTGQQIRGFGFGHDGSFDTMTTFLSGVIFQFPSSGKLDQVVNFLLAYPSEHAPIVGQQITVSSAAPASSAVRQRIQLLRQRSEAGECEMIATGVIDNTVTGAILNSEGSFTPSWANIAALQLDDLINLAVQSGNAMTFSCVPLGNGRRIALDRDRDGVLNGDD